MNFSIHVYMYTRSFGDSKRHFSEDKRVVDQKRHRNNITHKQCGIVMDREVHLHHLGDRYRTSDSVHRSASARRTSALSPACLLSLKSCSRSSVARLKAENYTILIMRHTGLPDITCLRLQQSLRAKGSTMRPSA